jgi:hypothetical protein
LSATDLLHCQGRQKIAGVEEQKKSGINQSGERSIYAHSVLAATLIVIPSGEIEQIPCPNPNRLDGDIQHNQLISTMSFSFGFSGDDVGDDNDIVGQNDNVSANAGAQSQFVGLPAEEHSLDDLVGLYFIFGIILCHVRTCSWSSLDF